MVGWTIRRKLLSMTASGLIFVAAVSAAGYWGISTVTKTIAEVSATSSAIRNHVEAGVYLDMARADVSAVFMHKGEDQQNKVEELLQHAKLLKERMAKARMLAVSSTMQANLADEHRLTEQYITSSQELVDTIVHNPSAAASQLGNFLQLYKDLQQKIEVTSDQLETEAKDAERSANIKASRAIHLMFVMGGLSLLLLLVIALRTTASITRPLASLSALFEEMAKGANDLTWRVDEDRKDEIGELGKWLNMFIQKVHDIVAQIAGTAEHVASATDQISSGASQQAQGAAAQKEQALLVGKAMQEMSSTVLQVSEHSARAAGAARNASETARAGGDIVNQTLVKMRAIAESVSSTGQKITALGKSSDHIGRIINVIDDIADQTNLLALNAAIEAARAGEQGRGFAVVADEVRKLAERTTTATKEIAQMIKQVQDETQKSVRAMEAGTRQAEEGVLTTAKAGDSLKEIIQMAEEVGSMITQIASASTEQSSATEEVNRNLESIEKIVHDSAGRAEDAAKACQDLSGLAIDLQKLVGSFKLRTHDGSGKSSSTLQGKALLASASNKAKGKAMAATAD